MKIHSTFRRIGYTSAFAACLAGSFLVGGYWSSRSKPVPPGVPADGSVNLAKGQGKPLDGDIKNPKPSEPGTWKSFTGSADEMLETALAIPGHNETIYFVIITES